MEDDLERAVEIALRQDSDGVVRQQAIAFCEQVKTSGEGWRTCLRLFTQAGRRSDNARFFCLQVLEGALRSRSADLGQQNIVLTKETLVGWNDAALSTSAILDPPFLRNKLAEIYSLLFVHLYITAWPNFFSQIHKLIFGSEQSTSTSNSRAVDFYFRVCIAIEQEIADVLIVRTADEAQRSTLLKDEIRRRDMAALPDVWFSLFAQYQASDKGIVALGLKVVAAWVSWIDIALIVNEAFMRFLFGLLQDAELRNPACDALVGIISKKMSSIDKVQLISLLNLPNLMQSLESGISADPDFAENVARLVNAQCVELSKSLAKTDLDDATSTRTTQMLFKLVPFVLTFLANEYDETSAAVFPAVNDILALIRKNPAKSAESTKLLSSILQAVVLKMKYDESCDWGDDSDAIEDAEFSELRVKLRAYQDIIITADFELYTKTTVQLVTSTFNALATSDWRQVELAMYILYLYGESLRSMRNLPRDAVARQYGQAELNNMLSLMMNSKVSTYPHPSIQDHFFEIVVRYSTFFEERSAELMAVLETFIDSRGLHHPMPVVQNRSWYLFSRFVKALSTRIGDANVGRQVLDAMRDLLVVEQTTSDVESDNASDAGLESRADPFDNRLYLFEAVGTLVSIKAVAEDEQAQLGRLILEPLFVNIEQSVQTGSNGKDNMLFLQHNIMAIGRFAQGFPTEGKTRNISSQWIPIFDQASDYILAAFEAQLAQASIRDAVRFAFARIVNVQDQRMAVKMPRLISGMIEQSSIAQISEFLPFLGQLVFKLKTTAQNVLDDALSPLLNKIFHLLNSSIEGTDDQLRMIELRKAYLAFVLTLFSNGYEAVFVSPKNQAAFEPFLGSIVHYASDTTDPSTQKLAFSCIREMISGWCTPNSPQPTNGITHTPLPGFDDFLSSSLLPLCFEVPAKRSFDLKDAATNQVVAEIATVLKQISITMNGIPCIQRYLTGVSLANEQVEYFTKALREMDQKRFKAYFRQFCHEMY